MDGVRTVVEVSGAGSGLGKWVDDGRRGGDGHGYELKEADGRSHWKA